MAMTVLWLDYCLLCRHATRHHGEGGCFDCGCILTPRDVEEAWDS